MSNTLVAYFSCSGVTEKLANKIKSVIDADIYEIEPAVPYTDADLNWQDKNARSTIEMNDKKSRPEIGSTPVDMSKYDVIYVGFPIWWYVAPTIINTFLESYDFAGKTVIPFATSGSSGVGETDKYLHASCSKDTNWRPAKRFSNSVTESELKNWVSSLKL